MNTFKKTLLATLWPLAAASAVAAPVFSTGPGTGNHGAYNISSSFTVSNAFTLATSAHITDFSFGLALSSGGQLGTLAWSIGTGFFDNSLASGSTATYGSTALPNGSMTGTQYTMSEIAVEIPDIDLGPGTYYLTLHALSRPAGAAFWDAASSGLSPLARQISDGLDLGTVQRGSFTLNGSTTLNDVPEPGSLVLAGVALFAAGVARRRA